jgi:hypothetical protein
MQRKFSTLEASATTEHANARVATIGERQRFVNHYRFGGWKPEARKVFL